ncbi:hypothetical protein BC829DRAFT_396971 [Chytridium lagenaria]|nr:hypothetical protein BC829DRAFT_396971 [Chytridium lagenaria]
MSTASAVAALHGYRQIGPFFIGGPTAPYVNKYAQYYRDQGHTVVVTLESGNSFFFSGPGAFKKGVPVLEELGVLKGGRNKAVVHAFSNGGTINLHKLTTLLTSLKKPLQTSAIILDSTPGRSSIDSALTAFTHNTKGLTRLLFRFFLRAVFTLIKIYYTFRGIKETAIEKAARNAVTKMGGLEGPRLFLYSRKDELVKWNHVEEYQEMGRGDGVVVVAKRFEDAEHVKLIAKVEDRKVYWDEVEKVLDQTEDGVSV